jgi:DNA polymerase-3 subunit delta'
MDQSSALDFIMSNFEKKPCWLLYGPKGIGKLDFALNASSLIAQKDDARSASTLKTQMSQGTYPNYYDLSCKEKNDIPVQDVKSLIEKLKSYPLVEGYRFVVINALDNLNRFGANSLLKTLEEPPFKTIFFLLAHNLSNVLPTIKSRCCALTLSTLSAEELKKTSPEAGDHFLFLSQGRLKRLTELTTTPLGAQALSLKEFLSACLQKNQQRAQMLIEGFKKQDIPLSFIVETLMLFLRKEPTEKNCERYEALLRFYDAAQDAHLDKGQSFWALFILLSDPEKQHCF